MARLIKNNSLITKKESAIADISTLTGNHTLVIEDAYSYLKMNNASDATITVPPNASVAFDIGTIIPVERYNTGNVTFAPGSGVTINSAGGADRIKEQYGSAFLRKDATNTWVLIGNIEVSP